MEDDLYTPEELILIPYDFLDKTEAEICEEINYHTYDWLKGTETSRDFLDRISQLTEPENHLDRVERVWRQFGII